MKNAVPARITGIVLPPLLLFWLFCLPLAFSVYTPYLYQANCYWNERCDQLGEQQTERRISELNRFFLHLNTQLPQPWTQKENIHMGEVRQIYDSVFIVFILLTLFFIFDYRRGSQAGLRYRRYTRNSLLISVALMLCALLLIPFFKVFWMNVFHPLLFDNELWRTNRSDVSWYLVPKLFFMRAILFITVTTLLLNLALWWWHRKAPKP